MNVRAASFGELHLIRVSAAKVDDLYRNDYAHAP